MPRGITGAVFFSATLGVAAGYGIVRVVGVETRTQSFEVDAIVEPLERSARRALESGDRAKLAEWARAIVKSSSDIEGIRLRAARGDVLLRVPPDLAEVDRAADGSDAAASVRVVDLDGRGKLELVLRAAEPLGSWWIPFGLGGLAALLAVLFVMRRKVTNPLEELRHRIPALGKTPNDRVDLPGACSEIVSLGRELGVAASRIVESDHRSRQSLVEMEHAFDRIHAVFHSIDAGVIVVDRDGRFVFANPSARALLELPERDSYEDIAWPESDCLRIEGAQREAMSKRRTTVLQELDIGGRSFDVSITPLKRQGRDDESRGPSPGVAFVLVDRTQVHELARLKDDFLSSVSHELRTPLTSIRSFTELLMQMSPEDGDTWQEFLTIINTETHRLSRIVDDVLDLSEIETGKLDFEIEEIDLSCVVENVVAAFAPAIKAQGVRIDEQVAIDLPHVLADHDRMHQLLMNVIGNALKFVPENGTVRVGARVEGDMVVVAVEDSGPGVPEEARETIFEKFKQVGDTLTSKPQGTGLGLSICREIVERMGGRIECTQSAELGGACLTFSLARARLSGASFTQMPSAVSASRG